MFRRKKLFRGLNKFFSSLPTRWLEVTTRRAKVRRVNLSSNSELWSLYQKVRTYFQQNPDLCTARGARGGSDLNRTLDESPRHRLASLGNPERKITPCISDLRKECFSFGVLPSITRAVWRGEMLTRQSKTIFAGGKGFALPRLFLCGAFVSAAQEGGGGMRGAEIWTNL